jgi:hypothetical protein
VHSETVHYDIRTHWSLEKGAPVARPVQRTGSIKSFTIFGGLHHRYARFKFSVQIAKAARLTKIVEVVVAELDRQGVAETLAGLGFDPTSLARAVIKTADGDVIDLAARRDAR